MGNLYDCGRIRNSKQSYNAMSVIKMKLDTMSGTLSFYKADRLIHSCQVQKRCHLSYNLAVSMKDVTVSIIDFDCEKREDLESKMVNEIENIKESIDCNLQKFKQIMVNGSLDTSISELLESVNAFKEYLENARENMNELST